MRPDRLSISRFLFAWMLAVTSTARSEAGTATTSYDSTGGTLEAGGSREARVVLTGTLLLRNGSDRHDVALLGVDGDDPQWFGVNREITPEITLIDVQPRRVLLRQKGKILEVKFSTQSGTVVNVQEQEAAPIPALPAHANALVTPVPGIVHFSDTHFKVSRKVVTDYLHTFAALQDNRARMLEEGGVFITRLRNDSILEKIGLRVGDVLTAVDGKPLKNLTELQRLLDQLTDSKKSRRVDLELTRYGRTQHLTYDLND